MDALFTAFHEFLDTLIPAGATLLLGDSMLALNELLAYVLVLGFIYWILKKFIMLFDRRK